MSKALTFPRKFVWGVAAAAPQIEGAAFEDGKGESVWDRFARVPGAVDNGETLDVACDHYHLYKQDFKLMRKLGIKNYRLSIAWPRIFPDGDGALNQKGLDFYNRLIDAMLAQEITPWVTMFHWDLPQSLEDRGGWRSRVTVDAFRGYSQTIVKAFGDRVKDWITLNEVTCFTGLGYGLGDKAPGAKESRQVINQTYHNAMLCHGVGMQAVREYGGRRARAGITDNSPVFIPVTETEADIAATKRCYADHNTRVIAPIYTGAYPASYLRNEGKDRPIVAKGDMELISVPTDFLGLNIYCGSFVRAKRSGYEILPFSENYPAASCTWLKHTPQATYWGTRLPHEVYGVKDIYITENGCGYYDDKVENGEVFDLHRRDLVRNYLVELHRAIQDGVPVRGYFLWSFMDNFEWQDGYKTRFGITHVDYKTQKRTPKLSAHWYSKVITGNRIV